MSPFGVKLGVVLPQIETSADPAAIRTYAAEVEAMGYDHVALYDHVLGASPDRPGGWRGPYKDTDPFHEVLVTLGFIAALTTRLELVTEVLILPQRQTTLVAKQAAQLDLLSAGRLRLGVGLGWNRVEYEALGEDFSTRGRRVEEQIALMRRLWTEPVVDYTGEFHRVDRAGINPLPTRSIPVWMGGTADVARRRIARVADGWMMNTPTGEDGKAALAEMRELLEQAGRQPGEFGIEVRFALTRGISRAVERVHEWRELGISHASINTMGAGFAWPGQHLDALRQFREAFGAS